VRVNRIQITEDIADEFTKLAGRYPSFCSDAVAQLAKLVGNEFELARVELSEKASQVGRAAP